MKVNELYGEQLDYWVMKAEQLAGIVGGLVDYSSSWGDAGPIIERERITIAAVGNRHKTWFAEISGKGFDTGVEVGYGDFQDTDDEPLVAAMRVYVMSKFGEEVADQPS